MTSWFFPELNIVEWICYYYHISSTFLKLFLLLWSDRAAWSSVVSVSYGVQSTKRIKWRRHVKPWLVWAPSHHLQRRESPAVVLPWQSAWERDSGWYPVWTWGRPQVRSPSWSSPGLRLVWLVLSHSPCLPHNCRLQLFLLTATGSFILLRIPNITHRKGGKEQLEISKNDTTQKFNNGKILKSWFSFSPADACTTTAVLHCTALQRLGFYERREQTKIYKSVDMF